MGKFYCQFRCNEKSIELLYNALALINENRLNPKIHDEAMNNVANRRVNAVSSFSLLFV